ncbi:ECF-type sigma factor [Ahniella affigens]|nr:ECF-type sigma factor [Ahniella affigens]
MTDIETPITSLLGRWRSGDRAAEDQLARAIYPLLRQVAISQVRRQGQHLTLGATDLAQEAYLRLREQQKHDWQNREQFFAIAATVVRRVVIDYLRERFADKRGGGKLFVELDQSNEAELTEQSSTVDWIAVDQALSKLTVEDPICARVVELKLFTPLGVEDIAKTCQLSVATITRHWRYARSWLARELETGSIPDDR